MSPKSCAPLAYSCPVTSQVRTLYGRSASNLGSLVFPAEDLASAQVALSSSIASNVSSWVNSSHVAGPPASFAVSQLLNSVAIAQLQLSTLDCASLSCGPGVCAVVYYIPTCNCSGTGFAGAHCETNLRTPVGSGASECACTRLDRLLTVFHVCAQLRLVCARHWTHQIAAAMARVCPTALPLNARRTAGMRADRR